MALYLNNFFLKRESEVYIMCDNNCFECPNFVFDATDVDCKYYNEDDWDDADFIG